MLDHRLPPPVARTLPALGAILGEFRGKGERVALVPTMGALHEGHLSLVRLARGLCERVVVSIFVNPRQFAAHEDLGTYPRTEDADLDALRRVHADLVWMPDAQTMYPHGYQTTVTVPDLAAPLDGASRGPGYFAGIATVVAKLFNQVRPDSAVFGEKDYQQLLVIRRMVRDLDFGIEILGAPIVREGDGLAMSSRNAYLSPDERKIAGWLNVEMSETLARIRDGMPVEDALAQGRTALSKLGLGPVDYLELRHEADLSPVTGQVGREDWGRARLFAAVMLGRTRLIDNMSLAPA